MYLHGPTGKNKISKEKKKGADETVDQEILLTS